MIIKSVQFESKFRRSPDPETESQKDVESNDVLEITFALPNEALRPERDLVIMINGLGEENPAFYEDGTLGLRKKFADRGIASVLMPLPFHFQRMQGRTEGEEESYYRRLAQKFGAAERRGKPGLDSQKRTALLSELEAALASDSRGPLLAKIQRLIPEKQESLKWGTVPAFLISQQPERLYLGYRQIISDVAKLAKEIKGIDILGSTYEKSKYETWFDPSTRIHLLGYSLGGLSSLAAFLKQRHLARASLAATTDPIDDQSVARDPLFETCTLVSSGSTFLDLVPDSLNLSPKNWNTLRAYVSFRQ